MLLNLAAFRPANISAVIIISKCKALTASSLLSELVGGESSSSKFKRSRVKNKMKEVGLAAMNEATRIVNFTAQ